MSPEKIYDLGEQVSVTTTIISDFVPVDDAEHLHHNALIWGKRSKRQERLNWYIDFSSGFGPNVLGYGSSIINSAVMKSMMSGMIHWPGTDWHHEPGVRLKTKLANLAPVAGDQPIVFLSNSGTEAVECALKLCRARRQREGTLKERCLMLSFLGGFHGRTMGSLEVHGSKSYHREGFIHHHDEQTKYLEFPEENDPDAIQKFLIDLAEEGYCHKSRINACILELVQGEGGIRPIDRESLHKLVAFCKKHDIYLIVDEVQTGMLRTGTMFACEQYDIKPDIICLAKGLGGGFPLGAVVTSKAFDFEPGQHGTTQGGMMMACVVSHAVIEELEKYAPPNGSLYKCLQERIGMLAQYASKGKGLFRRIDFSSPQERNRFIEEAFKEGVIVIPAGTKSVRLMPPITITQHHLELGINKLKKARLRM